MGKILYACVVLVLGNLLVGCATSQKVQPIQPGDNRLSCPQLADEYKKMEAAQVDVEKKKSMNKTNIVAAIFWIPGLAYTFYDAHEALKFIGERKSHLAAIADKKNCPPFSTAEIQKPEEYIIGDKDKPVVKKVSDETTSEAKKPPSSAPPSAPPVVVSTIPEVTTLRVKKTANVRSGPSTSHKAIALLKAGTEVERIGEEGSWFKVRFGNPKTEGWVSKGLTE